MGWKFSDLFGKKDRQQEELPEQEVCDSFEFPDQEIDAQLMELFTGDMELFIRDDVNYNALLARDDRLETQTKPIQIDDIQEAQWKQIQYLYVFSHSPIIFEKKLPSHEARIAKNGFWLFINSHALNMNSIIQNCAQNLRFLRIDGSQGAPLDVTPMKQLRFLHVCPRSHYYETAMRIIGLEQLAALETLRLDGTFNFTTLNVAPMKALQELTIRHNQCLQAVEGLDALPRLKHLELWDVEHIRTLELSGIDQLEHLYLGYLIKLTTIPALNQFRCLRTLGLDGNHSMRLRSVDLTQLRMLETLVLRSNLNLQEIQGLKTLDHLEHLDISRTAIRTIPDDLRGKPLRKLNLSYLELDALPDWLPELGLSFIGNRDNPPNDSIILYETTVKDVDMSIFWQPQEMILQWFESRKKGATVQLNEIKVVFLGDGESGKSHTIARLLNDGGTPLDYTDQSTPGIVIKNKDYPMDGRQIRVHYWDFGGQEILHSMHRIFLTERTLYVVLVNARDETQDARARYWLHNVSSFAKDAPVILVLNKIDQNPKAKVNEPELRSKYKNLRQVVSMSALKDEPGKFNQEFTRVLLEEIRKTGYPDVKWPIPWTQVKGELERMADNYIRGDRYREICRRCSADRNAKELLHWFNDLGVSYCCCDDHKLEDYMILKPDWITNALYIILFNHCPGARNGLIPHSSIHALLREDPDTAKEIRRVLPGVYYTWSEISYVLEVFHKSQLSFSAGSDHEFIPMLCDPASSPLAQEYEQDENTLEFRMRFDYLPNNLLHQLMVERKAELQMEHVWRTGALFAQAETGFSAIVTIDDSILKILVRHSNGMHRPNTYLSMLKANIDRIWKKMGLKMPQNRLVYKYHGDRVEFSYERLLKMQNRGIAEEYCEDLDRTLQIEDILNQAAPDTTGDQRALLDDIILACQSLQGNRKCWDWNENDRNTHVRDRLRGKGYTVNDQTLLGVSGTGNGTGELDLDIRMVPGVPWTVCEALIVDGYSKKWIEHLDKLLNNYNPFGLPVLYLLTYVDCPQDKFGGIWKKYQKHIREDQPAGFRIDPASVQTDLFQRYDSTRAACCNYRKGGYTPTVYHIFVRMGG